jgi:spermidine synthase
MERRVAIVLCLAFSGLTALVYQIVWTRLLGFAFGTTTEAVAGVLAVFFGGLALGSGLAAHGLARLRRPLRVYAALELGIGAFALLSLPLLRQLGGLSAWIGPDAPDALRTAAHLAAAAAILLPPTAAMGATLPVIARALVTEDETLGRTSALLYGANTLGAVAGAYLCGFWLIPVLGLARTTVLAGLVNLGVAAVVLALAGDRRWAETPAPVPPPEAAPGAARSGPFLAFFAVSGFVAIGYEIVWSKVFGIVMEGTLYGFAAVLSAYLLGIGLGSLAMASWSDRIRDLPRAFGLMHVAIAASVALGMAAVPYLPYAHAQLARAAPDGDAVHLLFALVLPIVLVPTALFGAAFPVLIRIYTRRAARAGRGIGLATAVNTAGSIAGSLVLGFWWIPRIGMDAALFLLILLDLGIALWVLLRFAESRGLPRLRALAGSTLVLGWVALAYGGVHVEQALVGRQIAAADLGGYARELARASAQHALVIEGRSSIVTVSTTPTSRQLQTNGLPEGGFKYQPPHYPLETVLLGVVPYLAAESPERALVIGLGAGNTVNALRRTRLNSIEVIELERGVAAAMPVLYAGRENPLDDPRVRLRIDDGRHELLVGRHRADRGYDLIASQPSHPWRIGAANLFTEEFFRLARDNLSETGLLAVWVNGFRIDAESLLAVIASFERVFPGSRLLDIGGNRARNAFLLLGGLQPISLDPARMAERLADPPLADLLGPFGIDTVADLLARSEGPASAFAGIARHPGNTDDNAFVETRIPRRLDWSHLDFAAVEARLPPATPVLPPLRSPFDAGEVARALLDHFRDVTPWPYAAKLERLLRQHEVVLEPVARATWIAAGRLRDDATEAPAMATLEGLAATHPRRPEPLRALGLHAALRRADFRTAARAFAEAHQRSGDAVDAYDAGRALFHVDRDGAWTWFQRIPESERHRFPRLAFYAAERAVRRGSPAGSLRATYTDLLRYRDTEEGRRLPGVDELLSRMAYDLGDVTAGRGFADAAARERLRAGEAELERAAKALDEGRTDDARTALAAAALLAPADERLAALRVRLAIESGDAASLAAALRELRFWAPSLRAGVGAENRLRSVHRLALLPEPGAEPRRGRADRAAGRVALPTGLEPVSWP